ncbi:MAG: peptide chain release factor 1 [Acidimicrobiales bacterium]|nr:peptide chain release factor 1 [Acidimicrobiales bacterium]
MADLVTRLAALETELHDVEARLGDPELHADRARFEATTRRHKELSDIVGEWQALQAAEADLDAAREMVAESTGDEAEMMKAEATELEAAIGEHEAQLEILLLPKDPNDDKNVIVEIRGAAGGEEANLFARDLYEMFTTFAKRQGWGLEVMGSHPSDMGGFTDITFVLKGDAVWTRMKFEGGTHRVQRVPVTESQGRVHTSSATVTVLPEADEVEVEVDENDLQVDYYRSSGPGGQSVNTTDSAVRITHKPTGITVSMQDEKSQIQNKAKALRVLRARLLKAEEERQQAELSAARKDQVKSGDRSEKIRTYNFKENRVTDHRIGLTVYNLDKVLAGELDEVSEALVQDERQRQLQEAT